MWVRHRAVTNKGFRSDDFPQKKSFLGSISLSHNIPWWRRSTAPERLMTGSATGRWRWNNYFSSSLIARIVCCESCHTFCVQVVWGPRHMCTSLLLFSFHIHTHTHIVLFYGSLFSLQICHWITAGSMMTDAVRRKSWPVSSLSGAALRRHHMGWLQLADSLKL